jgi:glycosyltransferase involved in cell wall biosynthesis
MARIKVVHLITTLELGGAELTLRKLLAQMDQQRFDQVAVALIDPDPAVRAAIEQAGTPVYGLGMRPSRPSIGALRQLVRLLRAEEPTILQTWLYHADLLGLLAASVARVPVVVWNIRNSKLDTAQYHRLTAWTIRACARLSRRPRAVIVNSEAGQLAHLQAGYRPREWLVIPNGIDTCLFRPDPAARSAVRQELGVTAEMVLIGLIARFDPMKDHGTFLRAAGRLGRRHPEARFLLAGRGVTFDNDSIAATVEGEGLTDRIYLLGPRQDVPRLCAALDIATSSSCFGEGFPNVVAEAMACGVPCVVTNVGDAAAIVADTGQVVPPGDPDGLAAAWQELVELGPAGRQALGDRARRRIEQQYPLAELLRRYETLYEQLYLEAVG